MLHRFDVINITQQPEQAQTYGIRSVPWFRIGELEFVGMHSASELSYWVAHATSDEGIRQYITQELEAGHLSTILRLMRQHPRWLELALSIIADLTAPIQARIGLGAVFEDLQGDPLLQQLVPALSELSQHAEHQVRADACYYLGLSRSDAAASALRQCLQDSDREVQEIAREALASIGQ